MDDEGSLEVGSLPRSTVFEVQLQISGSDKNNVRINLKDMILTPRKEGGAEGILMVSAVKGLLSFSWEKGMGETNFSIRARQCHHLPDTQLTNAVL